MKKCLIGLLLLLTVFLSGCDGDANPETIVGDNFIENVNRFILVEKISSDYCIAADRETMYEYYVTCVHGKYGASYVIGGNVLDKDGHPKKYEK